MEFWGLICTTGLFLISEGLSRVRRVEANSVHELIRDCLRAALTDYKKRKLGAALILLLPFWGGCSNVTQKLDPTVLYRKDMDIWVNGEYFAGIGVPKKADTYDIRILAPGKIDMITVTSCHKEDVFYSPSEGWFKSGKTFSYEYRPDKSLEQRTGCMLEFGAYEKVAGRHSWGLLDFEARDVETALPASLYCGTDSWESHDSTSACQAKAGLIQKIRFPRQVKVAPSEACAKLKTDDEMTYELTMPEGECTYYFVSKDGLVHRLFTFGYTGVLIR